METLRSKDGTTIAFDRSGGGPPLILVGGSLSNRSAAVGLTRHLTGAFTVIAYDRRGRGDSADTPPYAVAREIEDIDALIGEAGGSALVFGHSSGAVLALRAAAAGLAIPRLALYEPPFIVDGSRPPVPADYLEHLDGLLAAGRRGDAVAYFMTAPVGLPDGVVAQMRDAPSWPPMEALAHTLAYDGRITNDTMSGSPAPLQQWASLATPTLVMDGGASAPYMRSAAGAIANTLPNAEHRTLEGQDHGPAPEILAPLLVEFLGR
jgi:pimeloyl-ACP methyl ester carboxylesterase